jgi:hypothetical protein
LTAQLGCSPGGGLAAAAVAEPAALIDYLFTSRSVLLKDGCSSPVLVRFFLQYS